MDTNDREWYGIDSLAALEKNSNIPGRQVHATRDTPPIEKQELEANVPTSYPSCVPAIIEHTLRRRSFALLIIRQ